LKQPDGIGHGINGHDEQNENDKRNTYTEEFIHDCSPHDYMSWIAVGNTLKHIPLKGVCRYELNNHHTKINGTLSKQKNNV
jgi:hypothetical protein